MQDCAIFAKKRKISAKYMVKDSGVMKVLIISHTVISKTGNMGKTILSYFQSFCPEETAQFYIHAEVPTDVSVCGQYYRFTDKDALKSIFIPSIQGNSFSQGDIDINRVDSRVDKGLESSAHTIGSKRTAGIYFARNAMWKMSRWFSPALKSWLEECNPDVIFFASGDYSFAYEIALKISDFLNVPLVVSCVDDFYVFNKNKDSFLGRIQHRAYMKTVFRTMERASSIFSICDTMSAAYQEIFQKPCYTLHTAAADKKLTLNKAATAISYIGNLTCGRHRSLIELGTALSKVAPQMHIDVYSAETDKAIISSLTNVAGIEFHGRISAENVLSVMENSRFVVHTESFDSYDMERVKFSVSTKIAESLMYGPCLLAYGPKGIASIDYLEENKAAYVISAQDNLETELSAILDDTSGYDEVLANARKLARKNHSTAINSAKVRRWLQVAVDDYNAK